MLASDDSDPVAVVTGRDVNRYFLQGDARVSSEETSLVLSGPPAPLAAAEVDEEVRMQPTDRVGEISVRMGVELFGTDSHERERGVIPWGFEFPREAVRITVQDRDCVVEVCEIPDECPPLIGQIPLEALDFVVDPNGQKLIGNPDHGGQHMIDLF